MGWLCGAYLSVTQLHAGRGGGRKKSFEKCRIRKDVISSEWRSSTSNSPQIKRIRFVVAPRGAGGLKVDVDVCCTLMELTQLGGRRRRITARMSGFVRHCVITKECPETFLLFLYKTSLFPRLVQVLRICFLSPSPSLSTSLPPFWLPSSALALALARLCACGDTWITQKSGL